MKKIIVINQDKCIGCNTCPLLDPDVFELDQTSYKAKVKQQPDPISDNTKNTISSCPVGAISIEEVIEDEKTSA
ncbi:MAG: ferredoxin [Candidatus Shapirobacteria bacterium]|jgi:ferredoxin